MKNVIFVLGAMFANTAFAANEIECSVYTRPSPYFCSRPNHPEECFGEHGFSKENKLILENNGKWQELISEGFRFKAKFDGFIKIYVKDEKAPSQYVYESLNETLYEPKLIRRSNNFTSHGFTGLVYVYHPVSKAELQYWCVQK